MFYSLSYRTLPVKSLHVPLLRGPTCLCYTNVFEKSNLLQFNEFVDELTRFYFFLMCNSVILVKKAIFKNSCCSCYLFFPLLCFVL